MIFRIPPDIYTELITGFYIILAIIIFLWGRAIGVNETTEAYKIKDTKSEILRLRKENAFLKTKNAELLSRMKLYLNTFSGLKNLLKKGEL